MSQPRKGGLGRGLAALIPTGPAAGPRLGNAAADVILGAERPVAGLPQPWELRPLPTGNEAGTGAGKVDAPRQVEPHGQAGEPPQSAIGAVYQEIPLALIEPNPRQPRQVFDEDALDELVHSLREFGMMQPIVVRPVGAKFQIVMGERRWRASQLAELATVPAIVRQTDDGAMLRDALLENIHRVQLNPLEEAAAYQQLLEEFGVTHDELATRIGRSRPVVTNLIRLLRLPIGVQRRVAAGVLSAGHARALLGLEAGPAAQESLAERIVAEGLSVRSTEEAVTLANRAGVPKPPPARREAAATPPALQDVADRLSDNFDTKVTVALGKRKGKLIVEFGSVDDLQRIVALMEVAR